MTTTVASTLREQVEVLVVRIRNNDETAADELQQCLLDAVEELGTTESVEAAVGDLINEAAELDAFRHGCDETEVKKTEAEKTYTEDQSRVNAARVIGRYDGFEDAVAAMEKAIDGSVDGKDP